jgi:hypothetical protein
MHAALGSLYKASYQLHRHEWGGAPLDRWLAVGLVILAGLFAVGLVPGGLAGVILCAVLLVALLLVQTVAGRTDYVLFHPDGSPALLDPSAPTLSPADKLPLNATGPFEVEDKQQDFTEVPAYYRSFQTREHAVMALVPPSRLILMASRPKAEIGMWYMFFKNQELRRIEPGTLRFGSQQRPALRLEVEKPIAARTTAADVFGLTRGGNSSPKTRRHVLHLSFDTSAECQKVLADLTADASALDSI